MIPTFFRYPGGKKKIRNKILSEIQNRIGVKQYREPFFGGGSIGLGILPLVSDFWVNDKDVGIACLWHSVFEYGEDLKERIRKFIPSTESFYSFKEELLKLSEMPILKERILDIGFKKLAIHQISYSGLGSKSGGPLGGSLQLSRYKIDCRWSAGFMLKRISLIESMCSTKRCRCTNQDFESVVCASPSAFLYLDPPYYVKGNSLYQCGFSKSDHQRLSSCLKTTSHEWVLSYDDCEEIRGLYKWARIQELEVSYTISGVRKKNELLIWRD